MKESLNFKVGDSVTVRPNVKDPDLGIDISGWQGRISEINQETDVITVDWDSVTLKNTPGSVIDKCEEEGWGWNQMYLERTDVELSSPRDRTEDVARMVDEIQAKHAWSFLGEEGKGIQAVLADVDADDEWRAFEAWEAHLREVLSFPFEAEVVEFQERGRLQTGDDVTVQELTDIDDPYGLLVQIKHKRRTYIFPLCDLEATDQKSPTYVSVREYVVWFANR